MLTAYKANYEEFTKRNILTNWIFVEWNPQSDDYLSYELAKLGITCYVVDPEIHNEICTNPEMTFMQFIAKNVGIRRAKTDWVLVTNPDCLFGPATMENMQTRNLDPDTIYRAERRDVDLGYFNSSPVDLFMNTIMVHDSWMGLKSTEAAGDFVLFNRNSVRFGYDENITDSDVGTDGRLLANWGMGGGSIEFLGVVFKADHDRLHYKNQYAGNKGKTGWPYWENLPYTMPENWGLADCTEKEIAENVWYISRTRDV